MRKLRALAWKENGSITLFAALTMTFLIIFFMVLIDISRIMLFSKVTESTTKLAVKSVMSAYDLALYEKYGLFGKGGTEGHIIAKHIIDSNLLTELNVFDLSQSIKLVPIVVDEIEVLYDHFLGEHDELGQQIEEEMKYKAPIDFSTEVIKSFSGIEEASRVSSELVSSLDLLESLFEEREEALERALIVQDDIAQLEPTHRLDQGFSSIVGGYSSYISNLQTEQSTNEQLSDLLSKQEELTKNEQKTLEQLMKTLYSVQQSINAYLSSSNQALQKAEQNQRKLEQQLPNLTLQLEETFNLARTLNTTLSIQYDILVMKQQESRQTTSTNEMVEALKMDMSAEGMVRPASYFTAYESEINKQIQDIKQFIIDASKFTQTANSALHQPNLTSPSHSALDRAYAQFTSTKTEYYSSYISPATVIKQRQSQHHELSSTKQQLKQYKDEYKDLITNSNYLTQLATIIEQLQKDKDSFEKVNQLYSRNLIRNLQLSEQPQANLVSINNNDDGNDNALQAFAQFNSMLSSMKQVSEALTSHLYRNEYIVQRFQYLPLGKLDQFIKLNSDNINFHHQAVEYIMLGFDEPAANMSLVMGEIFAIRLAIRTIEGLIANKHLANPILIISAAIAHGLRLALMDMNELFNKGKTVLSQYMKVDITYPLYLRLLLSIHGIAKTSILSRIVAVIEHDLQLDFMKIPTSSIVATDYRTKLWILPSVKNLIPTRNFEINDVENGYYEKMVYASNSY